MKKTPASTTPSPETIARKATSMPWKENARINIQPYEASIAALRERGYSYGEIATWLSTELNAPVNRGQVYYVCQQRAAENEHAFQEALAAGNVTMVPSINLSPEEAEKQAIEQDKRATKKSGKKGGKR